MLHKTRYFISTIFLIFALMINLLQVHVVRADDGVTPAASVTAAATDPSVISSPTSDPTDTAVATEAPTETTLVPTGTLVETTPTSASTPTEVSTEAPTETTVIPTETLVETTPTSPSTPTEVATEATTVPTETLVESIPTDVPSDTPVSSDATVIPTETLAESSSTDVQSTPTLDPGIDATPTDSGSNTGDAAPSLVLSQVPDQTDIVVLDESGDPISLATQDAADALQSSDPVWCPASVLHPTPGLNGCSASYATITDLITAMRITPGNFSQDGTIFLEKPNGQGFTTPLVLDNSVGSLDTAYATLSSFNLTVKGGWNGDNPGTFSGQTNFGSQAGNQGYITIGSSTNPWVGNITIQNIQINNITTANSVTVYTSTGDITLSNVNVANQAGGNYTGYLNSDSGNIVVNNTSNFDGNNNGSNTNKGFYAKTNSGSITVTGSGSSPTFQDAAGPGATNYNGATLSAPIVTLNSVRAQGNDGSGIYITNANIVTLNNVVGGVNQNGEGNGYSGVFVDGNGSTIVNVNGGSFNRNGRYGVEVANGTINELSTPTCSGNTLGTVANPCYNIAANTPPTITVNNVTIEANIFGGWTLSFGAIGSASDAQDGTPSVGCTPTIGSVLPLGTTNVSCTATDSGGLTATSSGNVTIVDTTAPVIASHTDVTAEATSASGANVSFTNPTISDIVDGSGTATCSPASGTLFALGDTTVTCNATDSAGNIATPTTFVVHVVDTTAPVIAAHADVSAEATSASGAVVNYTSPTTSDAVAGSGTATCSPASGTIFVLGDTTVTCNATDSAGNTATPTTFVVHVIDTTAPIIDTMTDINITTHINTGMVVTYTSPATSDTVDGAGIATCSPSSGSLFPVGTTLVTCNATDSQGNNATAVTFYVTVNFVPVVTPPTGTGNNGSGGVGIPVTGDNLLELTCYTVTNIFGIKITFHNLCGYQSMFTSIDTSTLPGQLPKDDTFVKGINVTILFNGQLVASLPNDSGIQLDFPIPANTQDQYAVLLWYKEPGKGGKWLEVTQLIKNDELDKVMLLNQEDELYKITPTDLTKQFYQIFTTDLTGTFVIVKK